MRTIDTPPLDVCTVTYASAETVEDLVRSLAEHLPGVTLRVCDNSPAGDPTEQVLRDVAAEHDVPLVLVRPERNLGFGAGCNLLAAASSAASVLFLNPDAYLTGVPDGPAGPRHGGRRAVVGARVLAPDGSAQLAYGPERTLAEEARIRLLRRPRRVTGGDGAPFGVAFVSGAAMLVDRAVFTHVGGFDAERYFMYYEDIDLCRRVRSVGGEVVVDPGWRVVHRGAHSARRAHLEALCRSYRSAAAYHRRFSRGWPLFRVLCVVEAALKALASVPSGRVGTTDRRTQWSYLGRLLRPRP